MIFRNNPPEFIAEIVPSVAREPINFLDLKRKNLATDISTALRSLRDFVRIRRNASPNSSIFKELPDLTLARVDEKSPIQANALEQPVLTR